MQLRKILTITLIAICVLFLTFQIYNLDFQASGARMLLVLLLTVLYVVKVQPKRRFFLLFLVCFTLGEMVNFTSYVVNLNVNAIDYFYYGANILYILSYIFLIIRVVEDMNIKHVISRFWIHLTILAMLDIFCVVIVSGTTEKLLSKQEYALEFVYNAVIMVLLTVAMINYISKNSQKSMNLLLGAIFIFFSEVLQLTYFYISDIHILNVVCSFFLVLAFLFLYLQAQMPVEADQNTLRHDLTA
ncbi:MAG TPA: hypothetical protein VKZ98_01105 [Aquaticitalea sp.]|nr:hypothetical protein [Aquaticitalea sp.]